MASQKSLAQSSRSSSAERSRSPRGATDPMFLKPAHINIQSFGIEEKVNMLLINKKEYDFRTTMSEIIKEYPKTKEQKKMNKVSELNNFAAMNRTIS